VLIVASAFNALSGAISTPIYGSEVCLYSPPFTLPPNFAFSPRYSSFTSLVHSGSQP
ncbi:hypothetical protein L195_g043669, partial [Trifolium pratense]